MIYVTQYGCWWSFTPDEWREWLAKNLPRMRQGDGYELPSKNRLRQQPKQVSKVRGREAYHPKNSYSRVVQPLKWTVADWEHEERTLHVRWKEEAAQRELERRLLAALKSRNVGKDLLEVLFGCRCK